MGEQLVRPVRCADRPLQRQVREAGPGPLHGRQAADEAGPAIDTERLSMVAAEPAEG